MISSSISKGTIDKKASLLGSALIMLIKDSFVSRTDNEEIFKDGSKS